jgi:hypothetical protein
MKWTARGTSLVVLFIVEQYRPAATFTIHNRFPTIMRHQCQWASSIIKSRSDIIFFPMTTGIQTLNAEKKKNEVSYDGSDRGRYLFALVLFICIWQFSIPPSFRRAKFCPPACVKERTLCRSKCVTFEEWTSDIVQYYRDGGGIQWDFSIDPNTLADNERFLQSFFGEK